jgi:hypothetical protein
VFETYWKTSRTWRLLAALTGTALTAAVLPVLAAGPASATGLLVQDPPTQSQTNAFTYGYTTTFNPAPASSGAPIIITSLTPQFCLVLPHNPNKVTMVDTGGCQLKIEQAGDAQYAPLTAMLTHAISPAELNIDYFDASRASDRTNPAFTPNIGGLVNGDDATDITVTPNAAYTGTTPGHYPLMPQATSPVSPITGQPHYHLLLKPGTLTVNPVLTLGAISDPNLKSAESQQLVVDGHAVSGNRFEYPYGTQISYTVDGAVKGVLYNTSDFVALDPNICTPTLYPCVHTANAFGLLKDYWFASDTSGTITGNHTITYSTFDQLVDAANLGGATRGLECGTRIFLSMPSGWCGVVAELSVNNTDAAKDLLLDLKVDTAQALAHASLNPGFSWATATTLTSALNDVWASQGF